MFDLNVLKGGRIQKVVLKGIWGTIGYYEQEPFLCKHKPTDGIQRLDETKNRNRINA